MARRRKIYVEDFLHHIKGSQEFALDSLKLHVSKLKDLAEELEYKIERDGTNGYYSSHHDSMRVIEKIYTTSLRLSELKTLEEKLKEFQKKK